MTEEGWPLPDAIGSIWPGRGCPTYPLAPGAGGGDLLEMMLWFWTEDCADVNATAMPRDRHDSEDSIRTQCEGG